MRGTNKNAKDGVKQVKKSSTDIPTQVGVDACVCFADMTSIPLEILLDAKQMCEDVSIDIQW